VQGITEFLPISSSAHLLLLDPAMRALGLPVPEHTPAEKLVLDVAVHIGSLFAVIVFFFSDVRRMVAGAVELAAGRLTEGGRLALLVVLATIPVVVVGGLFKDEIAESLRTNVLIAATTLVFGLALYVADRYPTAARSFTELTWINALVIGAAQTLALIPGVSRSGITMTAARALGYDRTAAARFSLLLSIPTILGAGVVAAIDLQAMGNVGLGRDAALAAVLAFLSALAAIALMMRWLERASFTPFVVYRVLLGAVLLVWLYA